MRGERAVFEREEERRGESGEEAREGGGPDGEVVGCDWGGVELEGIEEGLWAAGLVGVYGRWGGGGGGGGGGEGGYPERDGILCCSYPVELGE